MSFTKSICFYLGHFSLLVAVQKEKSSTHHVEQPHWPVWPDQPENMLILALKLCSFLNKEEEEMLLSI